MGRIEILIVSIKIKNGFNHSGAPLGKRIEIALEGLLKILLIIKKDHRGILKLKVNTKCLEIEKI